MQEMAAPWLGPCEPQVGILGPEMGCILAMVLWEAAVMRGCCFSPPGNHILRVHVGKRKGG